MQLIKKTFLILLIPLLAFTVAHKFYISVTSVEYSDKDRALQITTRVFIDDFEKVLQERYGIQGNLATKDESPQVNEFIGKYLKAKFSLEVNGQNVTYDVLGKKYDNDIMILYLEVPKIDFNSISTISVQNEVLMDMFMEQKNVVHFKLGNQKKSFVLIRENNKGMLNLK
ncbi:hypothetical protein QSE00_02810 [Arenibacter sp. M-2]|uniref:DUF6702 family protein n=1 Tax=Arenibacter sp. M-2 TaxID=3053612 RepID=UPI00256FD4F3|nr:DUF6702 family protein [Arenibacter sp. M-2]MDL5510731.1 hypothetical protein [Arenibacter sp. M-2]|tara:strand:+ start:31 stop:540 length:510 start_codon:yes stop_codon:yes gene_type:complete